MWIEGRWERVGASAARPDPITTDQMDEVASEGVPAPTGTQTLNLTGLSYLWSKFKEAFAPKAHTHVASDVTDLTSTVMDLVYQVGDYWITESTQTPAQRGMPGVWSAQEDIFLVGAGGLYKVGTTGGERSHTLTVAEMPRHNHMNYVGYPGSGSNKVQYFIQSSDVAYWAEEYSQSMGGGAAHENMPPYRAVYIWKRTA
jgi:microcystin-dependent protein